MTDMVNLGAPMKATPDLRSGSKKNSSQDSGPPDTFSNLLKGKSKEKTSADLTKSGGMDSSMGTTPNRDGRSAQAIAPKDRSIEPDTSESVSEKWREKSEEGIPSTNENSKVDVANDKRSTATPLTARQRVMQKFMDSMKSEFGIPPQNVVAAMTHLSDEALLSAPDKATPQLLDKFDLDPVEKERAEALYLGMLAQLDKLPIDAKDSRPLSADQKAGLAQLVAGSHGGQGELKSDGFFAGSSSATLANANAAKRQKLNESLDRMNSQFFTKPETNLPSDISGRMSAKNALGLGGDFGHPASGDQELLLRAQIEGIVNGPQGATLKGPQGEMLYGLNGESLSALSGERTYASRGAMGNAKLLGGTRGLKQDEDEPQTLEGVLAELNRSAGELRESLKADPKNLAALQMDAVRGQNSDMTNPLVAQAALARAALLAQKQAGTVGADSADGDEKISSSDSGASAVGGNSMMASLNGGGPVEFKTNALGPNGAAAAGGHAFVADSSQNQNAANIQSIVKQAQYMLKKGGGEAVIQMNPEGLGQVHLKVMIDNGKINLEMKTQSAETKAILESGMNDLRASLGAHKFAIDQVKVDVNSNLANSNDHGRGQEGFKPDLNREQARNFFNQFHEDNRGQRDLFYETAASKAYPRQKAFQPLTAAPVEQSSARRAVMGAGRLDLVA